MIKKIVIAASTFALAMLGCASIAYAENSDSLGGHSSINSSYNNDDDNGGDYSNDDDYSSDDGYNTSDRGGLLGVLGGGGHGLLGGL